MFRTHHLILVVLGYFAVLMPGLFGATEPGELPEAYTLQYVQNFDDEASVEDFVKTDPSAWEWKKIQGEPALALTGKSDYQPPHRSPYNIALIEGKSFGDFVLEADVQQLGVKGVPIREFMEKHKDAANAPGYRHRDFCFFFGYQDAAHFMYVHIAMAGDAHAHSVFEVNDAPRVSVVDFRTSGADWGVAEWKKIRMVRNVEKGTITVYFEDMLTPIMVADDIPFKEGLIGFGTFDDMIAVDNIRIWAPEAYTNYSLNSSGISNNEETSPGLTSTNSK